MNKKTALLGLAIAGLAAAPVLAMGSHQTTGTRNWFGQGVYNDDGDGFQSQGASMNWVSMNGKPQLNFGVSINYDNYINMALRCSCHGMPAQTFQVDWKNTQQTSDASFPYMLVYTNNPTTGATVTTIDYKDPFTTSITGLTSTTLSNGFTRFAYNATTGGVTSGSTWNTLYFADVWDDSGAASDSITNAYVNSIPMTASTLGGTNPPSLDETIDY